MDGRGWVPRVVVGAGCYIWMIRAWALGAGWGCRIWASRMPGAGMGCVRNNPAYRVRDRARRRGRRGEWVARLWLRLHGYRIIARNWRVRGKIHLGEIDIIAHRGNTLVFVEVKSRNTDYLDRDCPIRPAQKRRLQKVAGAFLAIHPNYGTGVIRYDMIMVDRGWLPRHLRHIWED